MECLLFLWFCTFHCDFIASKINDFEYSWCTDLFRIQLSEFTSLLKFNKVLVPFYHYRWCLNIWKEVIFLSFFVFLWLNGIYTLFSLKIIKEKYCSGGCFRGPCEVASVVSDSLQPHRRQPTRLRHPWDSPGKNSGVGCHFLLQCMKVKSESEVVQVGLTLSDPMDCSPPGSSIHGIFQARVLEWGAMAFSNYMA